jgi:hypothetical protein
MKTWLATLSELYEKPSYLECPMAAMRGILATERINDPGGERGDRAE